MPQLAIAAVAVRKFERLMWGYGEWNYSTKQWNAAAKLLRDKRHSDLSQVV